MGDQTDRLKAILSTVEDSADEWQSSAERKAIPAGWGSSAEWDGATKSGTVVSGPVASQPDPEGWNDLLKERGLDPEIYEVDGSSIKFTSWDGWRRDPITKFDESVGKDVTVGYGTAYSAVCFSYKVSIRLRPGKSDGLNPDLEKLYQETRDSKIKAKPPKSKKKVKGKDVTLVINLADFQVGNPDGGGVESQLECLLKIAPGVVSKVASIHDRGDFVDEIVVAGLGDLMENCTGFYPNMEFFVELDHRDQMKLVRRFLRDFLQDIAYLAPKIVVTTVPGNHGEKRSQGKGGNAYTSVGDNTDVEVFEMVAEILAENPIYDHIKFRIPTHEVATTYSTKGHVISWTHGHKSFGGGGAPAQKLWNWWRGQAMGRAYEGVADSTILIAGHYHHLNVLEQEGRTLFICPSLTDVGQYFSDSTGYRTNPGVLMLEIVEDTPGVEDFYVLRYK